MFENLEVIPIKLKSIFCLFGRVKSPSLHRNAVKSKLLRKMEREKKIMFEDILYQLEEKLILGNTRRNQVGRYAQFCNDPH